MTTHTYAGYTAERIRAAAEAATQGKWRALGYSSNGREAIGVVDGIGRFIAERVTASGMMGFSGTDAVHIATSCPTTVLALLDRIAELENQQRQMRDDPAAIQRIHSTQKAVLYGIIAELEQRAAMAKPAE